MNFLAHLWLTDRAGLPLAGAILGDVLRGSLPEDMPEPLARSVRLHRAVDARTDRHPRVVAARAGFAPGARRYAGIVLDLVFDHALALDWASYSAQPLADFTERAAAEVARGGAWFEQGGAPVPERGSFGALLRSYAEPEGIERAIRRVARRLRLPDGLLRAAAGWPERLPALRRDLPVLLADLA
jgi:acyl carrier protein phosphodiesterase